MKSDNQEIQQDNYLDALREQAQLQLQEQKKQLEKEAEESKQESETEEVVDPYAEFRDDNETEDTSLYTPPTQVMDDDPNLIIRHEPTEEDFQETGFNPIVNQENAIYEGGPSQEYIELWKKQFPNSRVMHTKISLRDFVFRTLNRFEYKQIVAIPNIDALTREEVICKTCVLWPMNYSFKTMATEDSGYPGTLAQIIMESSGFTSEYGIEVL